MDVELTNLQVDFVTHRLGVVNIMNAAGVESVEDDQAVLTLTKK